jgi:hypothetical protein
VGGVTGRTSNRQLRTTGDELQKVATLLRFKLAHRLEQVAHALAVEVEAVVGFDRVHERWER